MTRSVSIMRRLILSVLVLELLSAIALIGAITIHERQIQLKAFDATLRGTAESLMGAVQDAEDEGDNVMLDMRGVHVGRDAIFSVEDEHGRILGMRGTPPRFKELSDRPAFHNMDVGGRHYRFLLLHELRIIDPGKSNGGVRHDITIVYGTPVGHVWHEVLEAIRFFAIATVLLLGVTAAAMAWLVRKGLFPVYELAREAEHISSSEWHFDVPESAKRTIELQPLATALEAALARLRRSFEQQRRFTNDAAHELKTDVAIVKSSLQLLSMRQRTVEEYGRGLALSLNDFTRLEKTVLKMLTLARLQQPKEDDSSDAVLKSCSLCEVIEEAVHQSKPFAELKALGIIVQCDGQARVPIDRRDALMLCSNILVNALQHSPDGATVTIALTVVKEMVSLTVQDQGEGIADEDRSHLFEPFYRGDPSRSRKSGGTGLGLSICKAICDRAGGSIQILNDAAGGARVIVSLRGESLEADSPLSATINAQS